MNALGDVKQDLSDAVSGLADGVMDEAVDALDMSEWYSLHVMTTCQGSYQSNSEAQAAELNVMKCSDVTSDIKLDMDIADTEWLEKIQDAINLVNSILRGLFAFCVLTTLFILIS
ncbi:hypothetical protein EsDP_00005715 [Epichloe bromicola]|uniref:Uncharacterized protein n=1 Tax=Epichloe bromicola TaxID=79588 RepID=A0ABQ0CVJ6_9HYPO